MGRIVKVKVTGDRVNPEFARRLEESMEQVLQERVVRLEELLEKEEATPPS